MDKETRITVKTDNPTALASSVAGANINALGFNIDLIAKKNPTLAIEIMRLYEQAKHVSPDDPAGPEEDFSLALEKLSNLLD